MLRSGPPLYILTFNLMTNETMQGVREGQEEDHFIYISGMPHRRTKGEKVPA